MNLRGSTPGELRRKTDAQQVTGVKTADQARWAVLTRERSLRLKPRKAPAPSRGRGPGTASIIKPLVARFVSVGFCQDPLIEIGFNDVPFVVPVLFKKLKL